MFTTAASPTSRLLLPLLSVSRIGAPNTWNAPPLRSMPAELLPTPMRARRIWNTAPGSTITVTPLGISMVEPSGKADPRLLKPIW